MILLSSTIVLFAACTASCSAQQPEEEIHRLFARVTDALNNKEQCSLPTFDEIDQVQLAFDSLKSKYGVSYTERLTPDENLLYANIISDWRVLKERMAAIIPAARKRAFLCKVEDYQQAKHGFSICMKSKSTCGVIGAQDYSKPEPFRPVDRISNDADRVTEVSTASTTTTTMPTSTTEVPTTTTTTTRMPATTTTTTTTTTTPRPQPTYYETTFRPTTPAPEPQRWPINVEITGPTQPKRPSFPDLKPSRVIHVPITDGRENNNQLNAWNFGEYNRVEPDRYDNQPRPQPNHFHYNSNEGPTNFAAHRHNLHHHFHGRDDYRNFNDYNKYRSILDLQPMPENEYGEPVRVIPNFYWEG